MKPSALDSPPAPSPGLSPPTGSQHHTPTQVLSATPSTCPQLQIAPPQQVLSVNSRTSQADLEHLLTHSHVVSLHCPLSPSTEGMLGAAELALMRPDAVLINTARGQVGGPHAGWVLQPLRQSTGHMAQWGSWGGMPCPGRCPGRACLVLVGHALSWQGVPCPGRACLVLGGRALSREGMPCPGRVCLVLGGHALSW